MLVGYDAGELIGRNLVKDSIIAPSPAPPSPLKTRMEWKHNVVFSNVRKKGQVIRSRVRGVRRNRHGDIPLGRARNC